MRGFTLLEILVALCIAGIVASTLVAAAWPERRARVEEEARRLGALLETADAEARANGQPIAWSAEPGGYAFWQLGEDGEWTRFPATSVYRPRAVAAPVSVAGPRTLLGGHGLVPLLDASVSDGAALVIVRREALGRVSLHRLYAR